MPRGAKLGASQPRAGLKSGTCGKCPCCISRRTFYKKKNQNTYLRKKKSSLVSDEELERRLNAKFKE